MDSSTPAQSSSQSSGDAYSSAVGDARQTTSLTNEVLQLGREWLGPWYNERKNLQRLKSDLGAWKSEAFDLQGRCQVPRLHGEAFEDYMMAIDAVLPPPISCDATSSWPHLLAALGIHPGTESKPGSKIITWRVALSNTIVNEPGIRRVKLDTDGSVLCHLANLFPEYDSFGDRKAQTGNHLRLAFGKMVWVQSKGNIASHAELEPDYGLQHDQRFPFWHLKSRIEPGTYWTIYQNALHHGISHTRYTWPGPSAPISDRVKALVGLFNFENTAEFEPCGCLLVTDDWIDQIYRIRRRALADGGSDDTFCKDLEGEMRRQATKKSRIKIEQCVQKMKSAFLLEVPKVVFRPRSPSSSDESAKPRKLLFFPELLQDSMNAVLDGYQQSEQSSWKIDLCGLPREDVHALLRMNETVYYHINQVWVVAFQRASPEWNTRVSIA